MHGLIDPVTFLFGAKRLLSELKGETVQEGLQRELECWYGDMVSCALFNLVIELTLSHLKVKYPEATADVLKYISGLREASVTLTLNTVRGIIIAHLQHSAPEIFKVPSPDGTLFRCSEGFVLKFLHRALGWNMWRSTRVGQKIPANADEILRKAFLRIAWVVKDETIPSELIVNSDQTQVMLAQGCHMTYASFGATQVSTVGDEEKRAIMIFPSVTNHGKLLPIQAIHKGQNEKSLPSLTS